MKYCRIYIHPRHWGLRVTIRIMKLLHEINFAARLQQRKSEEPPVVQLDGYRAVVIFPRAFELDFWRPHLY